MKAKLKDLTVTKYGNVEYRLSVLIDDSGIIIKKSIYEIRKDDKFKGAFYRKKLDEDQIELSTKELEYVLKKVLEWKKSAG